MRLLFIAFATHISMSTQQNFRVKFPAAFTPSPTLWKKDAGLNSEQIVQIDIALSLDKISVSNAESSLIEVSNPSSLNFGSYLTPGEVAELFAPDKHGLQETAKWLTTSGVPHSSIQSSTNGDHLFLNTTVALAEQIFQTRYSQLIDGENTHAVFEEYSLPSSISSYVDYVIPTSPRKQQSNYSGPDYYTPDHSHVSLEEASVKLKPRGLPNINCFQYMTPQCLRALYNIPANSNLSAHPNNSMGVYTPAWATWLPEDMDAFFTDFEPRLVGERPIIESIDGGYRQFDVKLSPFNLEPNLDYQYTMSLAYPLSITNLQVGDEYLMATVNNMLAAFDKVYCKTALDANYDPIYPDSLPGGYNASDCGDYKPPRVIVITYSWDEASYSDKYLERQCLEFLKLGLQGVTVLTGSGDRGTADQLGSCIDWDTGSPNATEGRFASVFPASCPWITTVGGTQLQPTNQTWSEGAAFPDETALADNWTIAGGGFSRHFPAPEYQTDLTKQYLHSSSDVESHLSNLSTKGYFNPQGRGYPDLSALARGYLINMYGQYNSVKGTSASTPVIASMIARVNDARLHAGKSTVGFINPVLYAYRDRIMRDVTNGSNSGCGVDEAFPTTNGWDAVTGLGSLDFQKLLDLYLNLP